MARRLVAVAIAVAGVLLLSSCTILNSPYEYPDDIDHLSHERMDRIIDLLVEHDTDGLRSMFSPRALAEAEGLDQGIEDLFTVFSDELDWAGANNGDPAEYKYSDPDGEYWKYLAPYCVKFADGTYYQMYALDYLVNTVEPDLVGLYSVRFELQVGACGYDTELVSDPRQEVPGIVVNQDVTP